MLQSPVPAVYPARYRDAQGHELTAITNDNKVLTMRVRGVEFRGPDFDSLEPTGAGDLSSFTLERGGLCACVIETEIPVLVATLLGPVTGVLRVRVELGAPRATGGIDREALHLRLLIPDQAPLDSGGVSGGWFEDELLDIQEQLPEGTFMLACINCAFSDYSPCGHGLFGDLACFRDNKQAHRAVQSKYDLFRIWDTMTEWVQETYLCPEFERRTPRGGRG